MAKQKSSESVIETFKRGETVDANLKRFLPVATAFICCTDGEVDAKERDRVSVLGKRFLGSQFIKKDFKEAIDDVATLLSGADQAKIQKLEDSIIGSFSKFTFSSEREKQALVAMFCEIAHADGSIHKNEARFIDRVSAAIEFKNPFTLEINDHGEKSLPMAQDFMEGAEAFAFIAKTLTDAMIEGGMVSRKQRTECLLIASNVVTRNMKSAIALMDKDETAKVKAFIDLTEMIKAEIRGSDGEPAGTGYSSMVYADSPEELKAKKRKVDIYASLGLLSIFGFLGSFGYAIFLFFTETGNPVSFLIIGVILFFLQKYVGKKHDELTG